MVVTAGALGSLTLSQCTVAGTSPGRRAGHDQPRACVVRIVRSQCAAVDVRPAPRPPWRSTTARWTPERAGRRAGRRTAPGAGGLDRGRRASRRAPWRPRARSSTAASSSSTARSAACATPSTAAVAGAAPVPLRPRPRRDPGTRPSYASTRPRLAVLPRARPGCPPRSPRAARAAPRWACTTTSRRPVRVRAGAAAAGAVPAGRARARGSPQRWRRREGADMHGDFSRWTFDPARRLPRGAAAAGPGAAGRGLERAGRDHRPPRRGRAPATSSGAAAARRPHAGATGVAVAGPIAIVTPAGRSRRRRRGRTCGSRRGATTSTACSSRARRAGGADAAGWPLADQPHLPSIAGRARAGRARRRRPLRAVPRRVAAPRHRRRGPRAARVGARRPGHHHARADGLAGAGGARSAGLTLQRPARAPGCAVRRPRRWPPSWPRRTRRRPVPDHGDRRLPAAGEPALPGADPRRRRQRPGPAGDATFLWSRENGSVVAGLDAIEASTRPRDAVLTLDRRRPRRGAVDPRGRPRRGHQHRPGAARPARASWPPPARRPACRCP